MARQVIIGNSAAGLSAVKAIREVDLSCPVILLSAENCMAYSPVLLTYLLRGDLSREGLFIADSDFYRRLGVTTKLGSRVLRVDPTGQKVHLENGDTIEYDNLLIATGATPVIPRTGSDKPSNVFSLRTVGDADKILRRVRTSQDVLIIGTGLIGMQTANAFVGRGKSMTLMELAGHVLPESIDCDCAAILQNEIEARGIATMFGEKVIGIEPRGEKAIAVSASGREMAADIVIAGIGLQPNLQLVKHSGIEVNRGILVNSRLQTNYENIFAAGDVSEGDNLITGNKEVLPTWHNASRQGRIAGLNMAGSTHSYEGGMKETISTIFGLDLVSIGLSLTPKGSGMEELVFSDPERKIYRKILLSGNRIVGAVLLRSNSDAGIIRDLIRNSTDISPWKDRISSTCLDMRSRLLPVNDDGVLGFVNPGISDRR